MQAILDASPFDATVPDVDAAPFDDPMALHYELPDSLRALMGDAASIGIPVGAGPWRLGQGNRAVSRHAIGRRACMDGLRDVVIQTPEQRARCSADAMVPVWNKGGGLDSARFCIDVFEFPNRACELPFVFVTPAQADRICRMQGKRLCTQDEWDLACRGDPNGGADRVYAYGDDLDLTVCNTDKSRAGRSPACDISSTEKLWQTCGTDTEPSGSFTRCRSRFGVFDQHGNVAEIMTRFEPADGEVKSQLKGSAFFYADVAKKPSDPGGYWTRYPDHCNFDPRWHVETLEKATHMNYHLGFRCCRSLDAADSGDD
jgi:formylglycine-generating enzyme